MQIRIALAFGAIALGGGALAPAPAQAYQLDTVNLVGCAQDGGVCRMPYPTNVYYGVPGRTNGRPFPQGGVVPCNSQTFGDPAPGQAKSCWYAPRITAGGAGGGYGGGGYGGGGGYRNDGYDSRRDSDRYGRDYDRPPARRPYDEDYEPGPRRYRGDPDDY
ncbi:hypothetical protein SAMN02799622_01862 [Methylobacterium sp. UNC378MF]|uniref:hypothetical protein n=1 Tax=Methylobacterium sp. UNC378MF TaxID=1502748 RepID=UPI00088B21C7|nr:hypothetical protein [Methylobacterium sp. UNC378MF]SDA17642.1 hypothetical protein SAMN02799622_01862 [Methylobacterium sp. UNC378MF]